MISKKRDRVHILKCEIFQFEDWKRGLVSLVEKFFCQMNIRNQTVIPGNSIMLSYFGTVEISIKPNQSVTYQKIEETK